MTGEVKADTCCSLLEGKTVYLVGGTECRISVIMKSIFLSGHDDFEACYFGISKFALAN